MNPELLARLTALQAQYVDELMQKPNVVGVGVGFAKVGGEYTETPALIVMVSQKIGKEQLDTEACLPTELEGMRVDVQEMGFFSVS